MTPDLFFQYILQGGLAILALLFIAGLMGLLDKD